MLSINCKYGCWINLLNNALKNWSRLKKLTPLKFLMQTSHTSSKIQYKPQANQTSLL